MTARGWRDKGGFALSKKDAAESATSLRGYLVPISSRPRSRTTAIPAASPSEIASEPVNTFPALALNAADDAFNASPERVEIFISSIIVLNIGKAAPRGTTAATSTTGDAWCLRVMAAATSTTANAAITVDQFWSSPTAINKSLTHRPLKPQSIVAGRYCRGEAKSIDRVPAKSPAHALLIRIIVGFIYLPGVCGPYRGGSNVCAIATAMERTRKGNAAFAIRSSPIIRCLCEITSTKPLINGNPGTI